MPIQFRCPQCNRKLSTARRKAGTQISCPQCEKLITVPVQSDQADLDELDQLLNPATNGHMAPKPVAAPPVAVVQTLPPKPAPPRAKPAPRKTTSPEDRPLFENGDLDAVLDRVQLGSEKLEPIIDASPLAEMVNGVDAKSLGSASSGNIVLTPAKATLLAVAFVVMLGLAFVAGYLIK